MRKRAELRPPEPRLSLADWGDAESVFQARRAALVPIHQPLVLISQIQRSGGTLLNSLLDGHPQLHVHPWEIQVGHPDKYQWPRIDLDADVEAWVQVLSEAWLSRVFRYGYRKDRFGGPLAEEALPLTIAPSFVDRLFRLLVSTTTLRPPLAKSSTATSWRSSTPGSTARDSGRGPSGGWRGSAPARLGGEQGRAGGPTTRTGG